MSGLAPTCSGPQSGNAVELYREGPLAFNALEEAFDKAEHHVHLVYYIWESDRTGRRMRDAWPALLPGGSR